MKTLLVACINATLLAASLSALAETAYWKDGGSGAFTDKSHWKDGVVPTSGWAVSFKGTTDAVVDDDAMALFTSFSQIQLQGTGTRLEIRNNNDVTIQKGNAWFVSDGIVKKTGSGTLTLDHTQSSTMISLYGGLEVREGELFLEAGGTDSAHQVTPACPVGASAPGVLTLPTNNVAKLKGLYGDGHVKNQPKSVGLQLFITAGTREKPGEFSGTFENYPVYYTGQGFQRFLNDGADIGGDQYAGYLGTALFPSVILRSSCEYEYLGTGETVASGRTVFMNNVTSCLTLNGGTNGALTVAAKLYYNANDLAVGEVVWAGDHVNPCVFSGEMSVSGARPVYWKKTGTGTWRFTGTATRGNGGVVATEKGRLEYDNMAEAGSESPLGRANNLLSEYHGAAVDESKRVSYAYLLGDGTNDVSAATATMAYIGTAVKRITTRPVALKGAGRFEATTAALDWTGFTSQATGTNTLVLAGAATGCIVRDVTNGVGRIAVVKEGTGDWSVDGNFDFDAGVEVRGGTLTLKDADYEWYRLSLMQNYTAYDPDNSGTPLGQRNDHDGTRIWLTGFGLFDAQGKNLIANLTVNPAANGKPTLLARGEAALGHADFNQMGSGSTYQLANLFVNDNSPFGGNRNAFPPVPENPESWVVVVVRLRTGSAVPTAYDLRSYGRKSWTAGFVRDVRTWKLEGSVDGVNWTELHQVVSNEANEVTSSYNYYSSNTADFTKGYGVPSESPLLRPASIACAAVSGQGALATESPIALRGLRLDAGLGGGTLDGFAFAADGTVEVVNHVGGASWSLPLTTVNCSGSLDGWKVRVNGRDKPGYTATLTDDGVTIRPAGLLLIVR